MCCKALPEAGFSASLRGMKILPVAALLALTGCVTTAHRPTPGYACAVDFEVENARATAEVDLSGKLLSALWTWSDWRSDPRYALAAYPGDGRNAPSLAIAPTGVVELPAPSSREGVTTVLSRSDGAGGWAAPLFTASGIRAYDRVTLPWSQLVGYAREDAPLWMLRRHANGRIESVPLDRNLILRGDDSIARLRTELARRVADPANLCTRSEDLYPEIIVT